MTPRKIVGMAVLVALLTAVLSYAMDQPKPGRVAEASEVPVGAGQGSSCPSVREEPMRVSEDSVGYLPVDATLNRLIELCPAAHKGLTVARGSNLPTLTFPFGTDTARATQNRRTLDFSASPDLWVITGSGAVLPHDVPITGTWGDLQDAYGSDAELSVERDGAVIRFCDFPMLFFGLNMPDSDITDRRGLPDIALVPANARIEEVIVLAGVNRRQAVAPGGCS